MRWLCVTFLATACISTNVHAQPQPVGHWPLNNGDGADISGFGNHGAVQNATAVDGFDGTPNGALRFPASGAQVLIPDSPSLRTPTALTVTGWMRRETTGGAALISKYNSNQNRNDWAYWPQGDSLAMFVSRDSHSSDFGWNRYTSTAMFPTGGWDFVAATYSSVGPAIRLCRNGHDVSGNYAGTVVAQISMTTEPVRIGGGINVSGTLFSFEGDIDEVRMYAVALTPAEIACLYAEYTSCTVFGDVDSNCAVDLADLSILLANFGTDGGATRDDGDLDGNGIVDLSDLALLLANFGTTCP